MSRPPSVTASVLPDLEARSGAMLQTIGSWVGRGFVVGDAYWPSTQERAEAEARRAEAEAQRAEAEARRAEAEARRAEAEARRAEAAEAELARLRSLLDSRDS